MSTRVGVEPETEEVVQQPSNSEGGQEQKPEAPGSPEETKNDETPTGDDKTPEGGQEQKPESPKKKTTPKKGN